MATVPGPTLDRARSRCYRRCRKSAGNTVGMFCRGDLDVRRVAALLTGYDLWMAILVIAFCLQVAPVLLVVMNFSLAAGLRLGESRHRQRRQYFARLRPRQGPGVPEFTADRSAYLGNFRRVR